MVIDHEPDPIGDEAGSTNKTVQVGDALVCTFSGSSGFSLGTVNGSHLYSIIFLVGLGNDVRCSS